MSEWQGKYPSLCFSLNAIVFGHNKDRLACLPEWLSETLAETFGTPVQYSLYVCGRMLQYWTVCFKWQIRAALTSYVLPTTQHLCCLAMPKGTLFCLLRNSVLFARESSMGYIQIIFIIISSETGVSPAVPSLNSVKANTLNSCRIKAHSCYVVVAQHSSQQPNLQNKSIVRGDNESSVWLQFSKHTFTINTTCTRQRHDTVPTCLANSSTPCRVPIWRFSTDSHSQKSGCKMEE